MLPRVIPTDFLAASVHFVAVSPNPARREINQLPNLQTNFTLAFNAPFQLRKCAADGRQRQSGTRNERMPLCQRINEGTIAGNVMQGGGHGGAGSRAKAPRPERRRNSRKCS